ncbi:MULTISPECIES: hypothetical protein [Mycolicibacterium]|uniref:hypothetical protein n=1 Tax=Mycolicibacterium TaxID=1866885 RepID=UPI0021F33124|nr:MULTISPECIES: hypothetical protein [Mycolicibacterium]MBX9983429.1 hypothetical protein [Mycobacterium gordonae]MCV7354604.1 hypothetical protein [Mycolicibacterium fluoranthenivorans]MCX2714352.1 hypothetical protein [Mycolicibacterium sp. J2]
MTAWLDESRPRRSRRVRAATPVGELRGGRVEEEHHHQRNPHPAVGGLSRTHVGNTGETSLI